MEHKNKKLLLKDLCSRVPYGVILNCCDSIGEKLTAIDENGLINHDYDIDEVKPYLFPLSSMTEEQEDEYNDLNCYELGYFPHTEDALDYLISNHFDYRGLIEKGLAIDATGLNIY